ncbi:MAG: hypothetical protein CM15mP95_2810 [Alphaproteobacteria bacterium]|nr:MAG: hypothetical protein CM15mP95_2810 [Alphaproteobacteria bacterium]
MLENRPFLGCFFAMMLRVVASALMGGSETLQDSLRCLGCGTADTVLFNDTIGYNIHYGDLTASPAAVEHAAKYAQIDKFIADLPDGYDTEVGEARSEIVWRRKTTSGNRPHNFKSATYFDPGRGHVLT